MTHPSHPVPLASWSLVGDLNGLGEAVCVFNLGHGADAHSLIVSVNPRSLEVTRVVRLAAGGDTAQAGKHTLPYFVLDLVATVVREKFPHSSAHQSGGSTAYPSGR